MSRWCPILVVMTYTKTLLSPGAFQWTYNSHTTLDVEGDSTHCRQDILWSTICILETNFIMKVWKGKRKGKKTMFVWTKFDKIQESLTWMSKLSNYWKYCLFFLNLDSGMERLLIACEMVYAFIHISKYAYVLPKFRVLEVIKVHRLIMNVSHNELECHF